MIPSVNPVDINLSKIKQFRLAGINTTFPLFLFGYTCQQNVLDAYKELEFPCIRRMKKVITRQFLIVTTIYLFLGIFGYINWPELTPEMKNGNLLSYYKPKSNISVLVGIVLLTIAIIVPMPLLFKPTKDCLHLIIYPKK